MMAKRQSEVLNADSLIMPIIKLQFSIIELETHKKNILPTVEAIPLFCKSSLRGKKHILFIALWFFLDVSTNEKEGLTGLNVSAVMIPNVLLES